LPYITLEVSGGGKTPQITNFFLTDKVRSGDLVGLSIPVGGLGFTFTGNSESSYTVKIILDKVYDTTGWVLKKYNDGSLIPGPEATFSTVSIGGDNKTQILYNLLDNGPFDQNSSTGIITDPVFPVGPSSPAPAPTPTTSSGGGIVIPGIQYFNSGYTTPTPVIGSSQTSSTSTSCSVYFSLLKGEKLFKGNPTNSPQKVILLKKFLNKNMGARLSENSDFDDATEKVVMDFQKKYSKQILEPWGITEPTGIVYVTTMIQINNLSCPDLHIVIRPEDLEL
jgi:hypothetical protein